MPTLDDYRRALQQFQSKRLRRDHADLAATPQYQALTEFFFNEMYGPRDFSARDMGARRLAQFVHLAPGLHLRDVEQSLELMDLTYRLDDDLARLLLERGIALPFDEPAYDAVYYAANNYDLRLRQIVLVVATLENVHRIAHNPVVGAALQRTSLVARLIGMDAFHAFLVLGYNALRPLQSADLARFTATLYARELARLDQIYGR